MGLIVSITFDVKRKAVEEVWRGAIIRLQHICYDLVNPNSLTGLGYRPDRLQWRRYLKAQCNRYWKVHFAKKTWGRCHGPSLLRSSETTASAADTRRHDQALYLPCSGKSFKKGCCARLPTNASRVEIGCTLQHIGRQTCNGITVRKATQAREKTVASGRGCRLIASEKQILG